MDASGGCDLSGGSDPCVPYDPPDATTEWEIKGTNKTYDFILGHLARIIEKQQEEKNREDAKKGFRNAVMRLDTIPGKDDGAQGAAGSERHRDLPLLPLCKEGCDVSDY